MHNINYCSSNICTLLRACKHQALIIIAICVRMYVAYIRTYMYPVTHECYLLLQSDSNNKQQLLYELYGVVEHRGSLSFGHYTAYVKCHGQLAGATNPRPPGESTRHQWYCTSDTHISEASQSAVDSSQAYLLFYKKL